MQPAAAATGRATGPAPPPAGQLPPVIDLPPLRTCSGGRNQPEEPTDTPGRRADHGRRGIAEGLAAVVEVVVRLRSDREGLAMSDPSESPVPVVPLADPPGPGQGRWRSGVVWAVVLFTLLTLGVVAVGRWAANLLEFVHEGVPDAYAQEHTMGVVIQYMEWYDGAWPRSWDDLREAAEIRAPGWDFDELRRRVAVDFDADPARLAKAPLPDD